MTHCDAMDSGFVEGRSRFVAETEREFDEEREMARGNRAAAIRDKLQEGGIAVEEATADLRKQRGVTLRNMLDQHTNDCMVSFYVAAPSGFEVEFGTCARTVDDKNWSVVSHEKTSTWSHVPGA